MHVVRSHFGANYKNVNFNYFRRLDPNLQVLTANRIDEDILDAMKDGGMRQKDIDKLALMEKQRQVRPLMCRRTRARAPMFGPDNIALKNT